MERDEQPTLPGVLRLPADGDGRDAAPDAEYQWGDPVHDAFGLEPGRRPPAPDITATQLMLPDTPPKRGVSRRAVLIGTGAGALGLGMAGAGAGVIVSRLRASSPSSGASILSSDAARVNHLLRRAGFGPSPSDISTYLNAGVAGSTDLLLNYGSAPDVVTPRLASMPFDFTNLSDLIRWFLLRMIYTRRPLEEKMTLFWHGVLTSSYHKLGKKTNYPLLVQQNTLLRQKGMGRFDDLIRAISIDPAMLAWLDGRTSTGKAPNENYSRELMELFTLGIGNYTQDDVHNGALALSGWTIQGTSGVFRPGRHYTGTVTFLGKTGHLGLDDVVALVCAHPATGKHLAWRMWSFFVYDNPSDDDLRPLVDAYYAHDHQILPVVRAMLTSPAFYSDKAYRARVKSPVEFVVGAVRALGVQTDGAGLPQVLAQMDQVLFDPPNVSGWDGDKASANWVSTQSWMARVNFVNTLVAGITSTRTTGAGQGASATATASPLAQIISAHNIRSPQDLTNFAVASLLDNRLDDSRRAILTESLAAADPNGQTIPLSGGGSVPAAGVRTMLYLLMSMPEYHLN